MKSLNQLASSEESTAALPCAVVKVKSPDGTMFVNFIEDSSSGKCVELRIHVGKSGSNLTAWAETTARLVTLALQSGTSLVDIAIELSNITSDKILISTEKHDRKIRSGPEALVVAINKYLNSKTTKIRRARLSRLR